MEDARLKQRQLLVCGLKRLDGLSGAKLAVWPGQFSGPLLEAARELGLAAAAFEPGSPTEVILLSGLDDLPLARAKALEYAAASRARVVQEHLDELIFDRFAGLASQIRFDSTNSCNLKCLYCYRRNPAPKANWFMELDTYVALEGKGRESEVETFFWDDLPAENTSPEDFRRMLANLGRPGHLSLSCASEPLVNPRIEEILEASAGHETNLVTNALALTRERAEAMLLHGLKSLVVSLDSADDAYTRQLTGLPASKVLRKLELIRDLKAQANSSLPEVWVSMVLFAGNRAHVAPLLEALSGLGVRGLSVCRLLPRNEEFKELSMSNQEISELEAELAPLATKSGMKVVFGYSAEPRLKRLCSVCHMPFEYFYIDHLGNVSSCTRKLLGNIFEETLESIKIRNKDTLCRAARVEDPYCAYCFM